MNPPQSHRPSTTSPLLPSVFPNEATSASPRKPSSRASSARQSPALRDDLPLPAGTESTPVPYISVSQQELVRAPSLQPFFAVVEDGRTGELAHPSVHYVFSDDDPDLVTAASLRSLGADDVVPLSPRRSRTVDDARLGNAPDQDVYARDAALPPVPPGVEQRYVLLDLAENGQSVVAARSLSRDWAVTGTSIVTAPTFDDSGGDGAVGGLMLKVEGMGVRRGPRVVREPVAKAEEMLSEMRRGTNGDAVAAMAQLVEGLRKSMDTLGKVVGNGDGQGSREEE